MSRPQPPDDSRPEESPAFWCLEVLLHAERGDFEAAANSQRELRRLGWDLKPNRRHRILCTASRASSGREGGRR